MKIVHFEGDINVYDDNAELVQDKLFDVMKKAFGDELEIMASHVREQEDE